MDRLSRFRRHKKDIAGPATAKAGDAKPAASRTPSPSGRSLAAPPQLPREKHSRSPFRGLHLRSSAKRARESPQPQSPTTTATSLEDALKRQTESPINRDSASQNGELQSGDGKPKMPQFLSLPQAAIENKFQDLVWLERNRQMQSIANPSPDFRWARVTGPHLRVLDRYMNIQPFNNNRVKLQVPSGHVDYINASPITLTPTHSTSPSRPPDRYIAMQGPKQVSTDHVWRMVVEQLTSPAVIVMLTETHEANMEKCFPYFPRRVGEVLEVNEEDEFGDGFRASVLCEGMEETPAGEAIELRKLIVRVHKNQQQSAAVSGGTNGATDESQDVVMKSPTPTQTSHVAMAYSANGESTSNGASEADVAEPAREVELEEERVVYHFLYKKWPDFGVPALEDLDSFFQLMRLSREKSSSPENPRIVHCSAGVGRTGTFIALEHLMRELEAGVLENFDDAGRRPKTASTTTTTSNTTTASGDGITTSSDGHNSSSLKAKIAAAAAAADDERDSIQAGEAGSADDEPDDLIFDTVNQLREQRRTMVQAEAQYLFLYQVLRKLWQDKYGVFDEVGEPAAKRQEVDPFVEEKPGAVVAAAAAAAAPSGPRGPMSSAARDPGAYSYIYMAHN